MDIWEYDELRLARSNVIGINDLKNIEPRTLLYGYTCKRETWHVYIDFSGRIRVIFYPYNEDFTEILLLESNQDYIPDKRLYPAKCDYEFCSLLIRAGCTLPFTTFEEVKTPMQYYGEII